MTKIKNAIYIILFFVVVTNIHMYLMHIVTPVQLRWEYEFLSFNTYFALYMGTILAVFYLLTELKTKHE